MSDGKKMEHLAKNILNSIKIMFFFPIIHAKNQTKPTKAYK